MIAASQCIRADCRAGGPTSLEGAEWQSMLGKTCAPRSLEPVVECCGGWGRALA